MLTSTFFLTWCVPYTDTSFAPFGCFALKSYEVSTADLSAVSEPAAKSQKTSNEIQARGDSKQGDELRDRLRDACGKLVLGPSVSVFLFGQLKGTEYVTVRKATALLVALCPGAREEVTKKKRELRGA